jgi:hypothetical protein
VSLGKLTAGHEDYYEREVAGGAEDLKVPGRRRFGRLASDDARRMFRCRPHVGPTHDQSMVVGGSALPTRRHPEPQ